MDFLKRELDRLWKSFKIAVPIAFVFFGLLYLFCSIWGFVLDSDLTTPEKLYSITMDVKINANGSADIVEVWDTKLKTGTELYRSYGGISLDDISNYQVKDLDHTYAYYEDWSPRSMSFQEKAYRYGSVETYNDTIELCWGISKKGNNLYTVSYTIKDFVTNFTDTQGIAMGLIPRDLDPKLYRMKIMIHGDVPYEKGKVDVYATGYQGSAYLKDGVIILESDRIHSVSYVETLINFHDHTYENGYDSKLSFEQQLGLTPMSLNNKKPGLLMNITKHLSVDFVLFLKLMTYDLVLFLLEFLKFLIAVSLLITPLVYFFALADRFNDLRTYRDEYDISFGRMKLKSKKGYFHDLPCDMLKAYYIGYNYRIIEDENAIVNAFLLKWYFCDQIKLIRKKHHNYLDLSNLNASEVRMENDLISILKRLTSDGELLSVKKIKKATNSINNWRKRYLQELTDQYIKRGILIPGVGFQKEEVEIAHQLQGLKNFLCHFSRMNNREIKDVKVWENYFYFASLLGVTKQFERQIGGVVPTQISDKVLDMAMTTTLISVPISSFSIQSISRSGRMGGSSSGEYADTDFGGSFRSSSSFSGSSRGSMRGSSSGGGRR